MTNLVKNLPQMPSVESNPITEEDFKFLQILAYWCQTIIKI
jgi:hypothetical protein